MTLSVATGALSVAAGILQELAAPAVLFPSDAGIVDVTKSPYNADPTGATDSTTAIVNALTANDFDDSSGTNPQVVRPAARTVYFPAGTYKVSGSLFPPGSSLRIQGAGEHLTTIKLIDNCAGFQSATSPAYLLRTGWSSFQTNTQENAGFANYIHDLTLDTGSGNPGAIGCRYSVANSGSMRHVTIRSSDPGKVGKYGLHFGTTAGPGSVFDVTIDGFDRGIYTEGNLSNDITFSGITLTNQRVKGIEHNTKSLAFEDLTISGTPLPIDVTDPTAALVIDGASLTGTGSGPAINLVASAYAWCRDVTAAAVTNIVTQNGTQRFLGRTKLTEWASANYRRGNTSTAWGENSAYVGLNLTSLRAPEYVNAALSKWTSPQAHGYTGTGDVGPALQAAIDSGAKVVYLPYGAYTLSSAVTVRGAVRLIDGMFSELTQGTGGSLTIGDTTDGVAIIQNLVPNGGLALVHNSTGTTVVRDLGNLNGYSFATVQTGASATGDLFFESAGANISVNISRPIRAFIRQMNRERGTLTVTGGATVRVFGDNVELHSNYVDCDTVITGSTFELIGGAFDVLAYAGYPVGGKAAYAATDSTISIVLPSALRSQNGTGSSIGHWVSDVRSGVSVGDLTGSNEYDATPPSSTADSRAVVPMYVSPA